MKTAFPATYSTLSSAALSLLISENYALGSVQCKFLNRGVNDTYLIATAESRFILRVYRFSHRSLPQIKEEIELLDTLKKQNIPVSYPISDFSGKVIQTIEAVEGERHAALFTYAPGQSVRIMNKNQLRIFGREMARFHNVSSSIVHENRRWSFDFETTLFTPLKLLKPLFAEDIEDYEWLKQAAEQAKKSLEQFNTTDFSKGYCHFDFLPKNLHFQNDTICFFDFDFAGYGWLVNDIMSFWQHLQLDVYAGSMTQIAANNAYAVFVDSYREFRELNDQELSAVPYLSLGFWLFYMGFHTTHDQFYAFIQPAHLKLYLGFLKNLANKNWTL